MSDESQYIEREKRLQAYAGPDRVVHFAEYLTLKELEFAKYKPFFTGFKCFDEKLGGLMTGEVTTITGHTGQGKTLLAETIARNLLAQGVPVQFFSFEVSPHQVLRKYPDTQQPLYLPLALEAMNVDWLADKILEAKIKYDCRVIILDHLHYLVDMATRQNMSLNIGGFMRRLQFEIASQMNVAVILIAHQDKGDKKEDASLEGIRDSTFISQESANVIVVSRRKDFSLSEMSGLDQVALGKVRDRMPGLPDVNDPFKNGFAIVQIAKSRRAGTFRWPKVFQKVGNFLEEL